ncbi:MULTISPECIES: IS256 family transposase [unclassified Terrabacter]|uniref:IS256 family transposase n=1 Tax=unclassified Terrabacter TaxID=2630222 RepID=UPI003F94FF4C
MTDTLVGVSPLERAAKKSLTPAEVERAAVRELVKAARARGDELTGPDGLLKAITKQVIEAALEEEMTEHVGYDKHAVEGRNGGNSRNGTRTKTVLTDNAGPVQVEVPRDRDASFEPVIVKKRQRRLTDVDAIVLSLYARGLTTGEISAHFAEIYGASVSKDTVSRITDRVLEDMQAWSSRPLQRVYAAVFIDAIMIKVRDGQVGNQPFYAAIGVDLAGHRDVLGLWPGNGAGESAKFWMNVLTELRNRGVADVFFIVCDGLKGLPESVNTVFKETIVQTCIVHLIRGTFRYASKKYWESIARDLRPIYTAVTADAAWAAFEEFEEKWGKAYPAIPKLWRAAWEQFIPFLAYDLEIRKVLCSTNAIESLNARYRRAVNAKGHFPTEQAALKTLYLVTRSLDPKGLGQARWVTRWKPALNAFAVTFEARMPAPENL